MRFPIRVDPIWRPVLLAGGATRGRSYVEVREKDVAFRFGLWFQRSVPRSEIVGVTQRRWPVWLGVGWRSNLRGVIGLIGSYEGVVEVKLRNRTRAWGVFPCDRIAVSLEDPEGFIAALGAGATSKAKAPAAKAPAPATKGQGRRVAPRAKPRAAARNSTTAPADGTESTATAEADGNKPAAANEEEKAIRAPAKRKTGPARARKSA